MSPEEAEKQVGRIVAATPGWDDSTVTAWLEAMQALDFAIARRAVDSMLGCWGGSHPAWNEFQRFYDNETPSHSPTDGPRDTRYNGAPVPLSEHIRRLQVRAAEGSRDVQSELAIWEKHAKDCGNPNLLALFARVEDQLPEGEPPEVPAGYLPAEEAPWS